MSSDHDKAVLNAIFNPFLPLGEGIYIPQSDVEKEDKNEAEDKTEVEENSRAKALEMEGLKKAEDGKLEEAVDIFTLALELAPTRPSLYNNRAQAYRLLGDDDAALADLDRAVELSGGRGQVASLALCQRALVHRRRGDDDSATADLRAAAALGSEFAKHQLVKLNPYAAMCNDMLRQMFSKLNQPT